MPGKQARVLCPVCQEPIPPDETECENCGAFVIDEAVVRLSRALGLDREKALKLFEAGFRHPKQLRDRDPDRVLEKGEVGILFICTNCGGFVASGDSKCPRCAAEFETEAEERAPEEEDILDLVLCRVCGADNDPDLAECEICGEPLREPTEPAPAATKPLTLPSEESAAVEKALEKVDDFLEDFERSTPEPTWLPKPIPTGGTKPGPTTSEPVAPVAAKPSPAPSRPKPEPRPIPKSLRPVPRASRVPSERPKPSGTLRSVATPDAGPASPRVQAMTPPAAVFPTKRVRTSPAEPVQRKMVRGTETRGFRISPEIVGGLTFAAAAGLLLAGFLDQPGVGLGIAAVLVGLAAQVVLRLARREKTRLSGLDGMLLAAGAAVGLGVAALHSGPPGTATEIGIAAAGALPFAWATRRLLAGPQRILLAIASAVPLVGDAVATALDPRFAGTWPWAIGILAAAPWPGALAATEIRRRKSTSILRRELVRAERDIVRRDYGRSLEEYDRAIAGARADVPGAEIPWYGKGATLILLGRYPEALRAIDTALDINPYNEVAWVNKGNALTKMGRLVDALRCFNAAIKVHPEYEVAWNNKGNALARLGKFAEALVCYERALEIDPGYRGAWVNKGFVLAKLGRFDEAATCADRALRLDVGRRPEPA